MSAPEPPRFDELLDLLRVRLGDADALEAARIHSFKELMADHAELIGEQWYWHAFEELEAQGHLDPVSHKENGGELAGDARPTVVCMCDRPAIRPRRSRSNLPVAALRQPSTVLGCARVLAGVNVGRPRSETTRGGGPAPARGGRGAPRDRRGRRGRC